MRIDELHLEHVRSYDRLTLPLGDAGAHLFLGDNGAGKSNLLEAVALLAFGKPPAEIDEADLIHWGREHYRARALLRSDAGESLTLEVACQRHPVRRKVCRRNDVPVSAKAFVGALPVVHFRPRDLRLFAGAPADRRVFLDQLLCQVSPEYLQALVQYQRLLKQRNTLLRRIAERAAAPVELEVWDVPLADTGALLTAARLELLEVLQCTLPAELETLGEHWPDAVLRYDRQSAARDQDELREELREILAARRQSDIDRQSTGAGPHRDDWHLDVEDRSLPRFSSRGQQRTAVLALLFLQVSYLELRRGERPVILLDDVFSELDDDHQRSLLESLGDYQVLMTATHVPPAADAVRKWKVADGTVRYSETYERAGVPV